MTSTAKTDPKRDAEIAAEILRQQAAAPGLSHMGALNRAWDRLKRETVILVVLERLEVPLLAENPHPPRASIQHVVGIPSAGDP